MPNWCECDLYLSGSKAEVEAVFALIGATGDKPRFDFNALVPYPERFAEMDRDADAIRDLYGTERQRKDEALRIKWEQVGAPYFRNGFNSGGYEWCVENWGTKWSPSTARRRDNGGDICLSFQTAYQPPKPIIEALSKRFPDVSFTLEYFECGMHFCGGITLWGTSDADDHEEPAHEIVREWYCDEYQGRRGG